MRQSVENNTERNSDVVTLTKTEITVELVEDDSFSITRLSRPEENNLNS